MVFEGGLPVLRERQAGAAPVRPWSSSPLTIPLASPGQRGVDRLRLRFSIDARAQLLVAWDDLEAPADGGRSEGGRSEPRPLGPVR